MPSIPLSERLRLKLVEQVRGVFNDVESGQQPVPPSDEALFARDTPIRMVHADIVAMMVGGIRGLLLQMLHPHALQGVLDFSNFRSDMHGRLSRTAHFITDTTFAHRDVANAAIDRVNLELSVIEKVRQFILADEPFGIENEEMTPSLKIRRHKLKERYGSRLDALYKS